MTKWTVVVTACCLLLLLIGCSPGRNADNENVTTFPTATLHPVFASGAEFDSHLRETRDAEATDAAVDQPSSAPVPTFTNTPNSFVATPTPFPSVTASVPVIAEDSVAVPILLYHHISVPEGDSTASGYEYFVSPDDFSDQMDYLDENGFVPIDLYMLYGALNGTADLPPKPVIITFDDGYLDIYENAFPILEEHNFTATFFLITDFLEQNREGYLTWDVVGEMAAAGMRFETHSSNHADLRGQTSDFLISQVLDSQELLAQNIGYTPRFIAYPFGQYDENLIQFLEEYDFWGGLTAQGGLDVGLGNRFTWPRLFIAAETSLEDFSVVISEGRTSNYQPEIVEETAALPPLTMTVSLSTTQGVITAPAVLVYDEGLNTDWTVRTSPDVHFDLDYEQEAYTGSLALAFTPDEDFGSFFLQVRPNASNTYLRNDIVGVAFWLYTGSEPFVPDDLALIINGSEVLPYWSGVDDSIDPDEYEPDFKDDRFGLGFNRTISESTWVQVILYFDDLAYYTDFQYITGINIVNNATVTRTFLIDDLVLLLSRP